VLDCQASENSEHFMPSSCSVQQYLPVVMTYHLNPNQRYELMINNLCLEPITLRSCAPPWAARARLNKLIVTTLPRKQYDFRTEDKIDGREEAYG
jgi:hypothetical protein